MNVMRNILAQGVPTGTPASQLFSWHRTANVVAGAGNGNCFSRAEPGLMLWQAGSDPRGMACIACHARYATAYLCMQCMLRRHVYGHVAGAHDMTMGGPMAGPWGKVRPGP